ncbi:MAG TPA: hypothetical protein VIK55_08185 [Paludibacter sp.]
MRNLFIFLLIIIGSNLYGQTDSIEKAAVYNKFLSKDLSQEDYTDIANKWNQTIKKIHKYPDLPLDQNGQVHYSFLNNFKNMNKEKLFHRALEYISINYGIPPVNLYSNLEDGKIIFGNSFNVDATLTGTYTCIMSIKDEKILTEYINIGCQVFYPGSSGDVYIPETTRNYNINQFYPIILKNAKDWNRNLNLFKVANEYLKSEVDRLHDYSMNYDTNCKF